MSTNIRTRAHTLSLFLYPFSASYLPAQPLLSSPSTIHLSSLFLLFPPLFSASPSTISFHHSLPSHSHCQPRMGNLKYESVYLALGIPVDIDDKILLQLHPSPLARFINRFFTPTWTVAAGTTILTAQVSVANNAKRRYMHVYYRESCPNRETEFEFQRGKKKKKERVIATRRKASTAPWLDVNKNFSPPPSPRIAIFLSSSLAKFIHFPFAFCSFSSLFPSIPPLPRSFIPHFSFLFLFFFIRSEDPKNFYSTRRNINSWFQRDTVVIYFYTRLTLKREMFGYGTWFLELIRFRLRE